MPGNVQEMAGLIHRHRDEDHEKIRAMLEGLPAADVADVLNAIPSLGEAAEILELLPLPRAITVAEQTGLHRRSALVEQLPHELAAKILEGVAADQRTAIVRHLSAHGRRLL